MWLKLMRLVAPFGIIARELTLIRELYELELASRTPPIIRITEKPKKSDTEVLLADEEPKKTAKDRLAELWGQTGDGDDTESDSN